MTVTGTEAERVSAVTSAAAYAQRSGFGLVLIDKTEHRWITAHRQGLPGSDRVSVVPCDISVSYFAGIAQWARENLDSSPENKNVFIQVLAEDDWFLTTELFVAPEWATHTMWLPKLSFETGDPRSEAATAQVRGEFDFSRARGVFRRQSILADNSWHAVTRGDIFRDYFLWLNSLPVILPHHSSGMLWLALARGTVGPLHDFLYVKDYCHRRNGKEVRDRYEDWYERAGFLREDLRCDSSLFAAGILSLLFSERSRNESCQLEELIRLALDLFVASFGWSRKDLRSRSFRSATSARFALDWARCRMLWGYGFVSKPAILVDLRRQNDDRWRRVWRQGRELLPLSLKILLEKYEAQISAQLDWKPEVPKADFFGAGTNSRRDHIEPQ